MMFEIGMMGCQTFGDHSCIITDCLDLTRNWVECDAKECINWDPLSWGNEI